MRIAIYGYGNLGRGVESAIRQNDDMELVAVFTRRDPASVQVATAGVKVYNIADAEAHKDEIDVLVLCGGSATDLPEQTPAMAKLFNVIDSFDTHARIPEHFANVDKVAKENGVRSIAFPLISAGIFGYPKKEAWEIALKACKDFLKNNEMDIVFTIIDDNILNLGLKIYGEVFND